MSDNVTVDGGKVQVPDAAPTDLMLARLSVLVEDERALGFHVTCLRLDSRQSDRVHSYFSGMGNPEELASGHMRFLCGVPVELT